MVLFVTGVGFLIHVYSIGYMGHDPGYARFFAYLNLFMFSMLTLVLGANYAVLFVGWEGVGLCSYLLIGFWFDKQSATDAGKKAFIVNRIGDVGFLLGMFLVFVTFGTLDFRDGDGGGRASCRSSPPGAAPLTLIGLLLFVGAAGKSAQLPLYVWLPDAMEGPTPVSALIHAATMVTAGVYMVARSAPIYAHAPTRWRRSRSSVPLTALFAATIGLVQNDIKRVLAYSTVSQLGYMFLACGVGAFARRRLPRLHPRLLQGAALPRRGLGDPRDVGRAGHAQDGRPEGEAAVDAPDDARRLLAIAGIPPLAGLLLEGRDPVVGLPRGRLRPHGVGDRRRDGGAHRLLHVPALLAHLRRQLPRHREQAHHQSRVAGDDGGAAAVLALGSVLVGFLGVPGASLFGVEPASSTSWSPSSAPTHHALGEVFPAPVPGHGVELGLMGLSSWSRPRASSWRGASTRGGFEMPNRLAAAFPGALPHARQQVLGRRALRRRLRPWPGARRRTAPSTRTTAS